MHEHRVIFHWHPQRDTGNFAPVWIATESRSADAPILFLGQIAKFLCLFVNGRRADTQAGLLKRLFLFLARDRGVQFYFVPLGFCVLRHTGAALCDAFRLHLEIFHASKALYASDHRVALFGRDQHAHPCRNASGIIPIELCICDLHFWRREALDVVVNLLHVRRVERKLSSFL